MFSYSSFYGRGGLRTLWMTLVYIYIYIYTHTHTPLPGELNSLAKELTVATCIMQTTSNELSTPVPVSAKCKEMEKFNTYTLNSLAYVADGCEVILSGWCKVGWVSIPAWGISCVQPNWWVVTQQNSLWMKIYVCIYIYIYIYTLTMVIQNVLNLTQTLYLSHTSHIFKLRQKSELFSSFIRSDSVLPQQKCSDMALLSKRDFLNDSVVEIGVKITTHFNANVSAYALRAKYILLIGKNMAALSGLILQMVRYFHAMWMRAGRKEHKNNEYHHLESLAFFVSNTNWSEEKQRSV